MKRVVKVCKGILSAEEGEKEEGNGNGKRASGGLQWIYWYCFRGGWWVEEILLSPWLSILAHLR